MGIPFCVICCFSLAAFNICSLCLIFVNLINMCLGVFGLGFILFGTFWVSWTWVIISFSILGKFSTIISSSIFSWSFFLSSSSGTPMIQMLGTLTLSQRSLRLSSFLLILFSSLFHVFPPFYLLPYLSYLLPPLFYYWFPPECFELIYFIIHYILTLLLFLLGPCKPFLHLLNPCLQAIYCNSNLFSRFGSFSLSLFRFLYQVYSLSFYQVDSLFCLVWWRFILFLYLLGISLPFHLVYIAVFGLAFLYSGSLWFLFIVEVPHCGWGWAGGLSRFLL